MGYLEEEGIKCELVDGCIVFEFHDMSFNASFVVNDGYAECTVSYRCQDEDYEKLSMEVKTYMADKVNTDTENHATVWAYNDSFQVSTSFYFTSKRMMIGLFSKHFEELTESLDETIDIVCYKIEEQKKVKKHQIGFHAESEQREDPVSDPNKVAAKA